MGWLTYGFARSDCARKWNRTRCIASKKHGRVKLSPIATAKRISVTANSLKEESATGQNINPMMPAKVPYTGTHLCTGLSATQFMLIMMWHTHAKRMSMPTSVPPNDLMPDMPISMRDSRRP